MAKLTSAITKPVTHPIKGQVNVNLEVRINDFRVLPDVLLEYEGATYTGAVIMGFEVGYTIGGIYFKDQMAPAQAAIPLSVYNTLRLSETPGNTFAGTQPERMLGESTVILRALFLTYFKDENGDEQSLYGLGKLGWTFSID